MAQHLIIKIMKPLPTPKTKLAFLNECHTEYKVYLYDEQNWHEAFDGTHETLEEAKNFLLKWYPELPQSYTAIVAIKITKEIL